MLYVTILLRGPFLCMSNMSSVPFFIGDLFKDIANEVTKLKNVCYM